MVLGGHGDTMVQVTSYCYYWWYMPAEELISKDKLDAIVERTRFGGGELVNYLVMAQHTMHHWISNRDGRIIFER